MAAAPAQPPRPGTAMRQTFPSLHEADVIPLSEGYEGYRRLCKPVSSLALARAAADCLRAPAADDCFGGGHDKERILFVKAAAAEISRRQKQRGYLLRSKASKRALHRIGKLAASRCGLEALVVAALPPAANAGGVDPFDLALLREISICIASDGANADKVSQQRTRILEACCSSALNTKDAAQAQSILSAVRPIASSASTDELTSVLLPAMTKAMLRSPEVASRPCISLLNAVSSSDEYDADAGAFVECCAALLVPLLSASKHADEDRRKDAAAVCAALAGIFRGRRGAGLTALRACAKTAGDALRGNGGAGKLTQWFQRTGVAGVLGSLSEHGVVDDATGIGALATEAVDVLVDAAGNDTNDDVRCTSISAMCAWLKHTPSPPASAIAAIIAALQGKDVFKRATYTYLTCSDNLGEGVADAAEQRDALLKVLEEKVRLGLSKVASRFDGLACSVALLQLLRKGGVPADMKDILEEILSKNCLYLSRDFWPKLDSQGGTLVARLASCVLLEHFDRFPAKEDADPDGFMAQVFGVLAAIATTHADVCVRTEATTALKKVVDDERPPTPRRRLREVAAAVMLDTLDSSKRYLMERQAQQQAQPQTLPVRGCDEITAFRVFNILVEEQRDELSPRHFALLLLLSQHVLMSPAKHDACLRAIVSKIFGGRTEALCSLAAENIVPILGALFGPQGEAEGSAFRWAGACASVRTLVTACTGCEGQKLVVEATMDYIRQSIDYESLRSVSDDDVTIFNCLEGKPSIDYAMRATLDTDGKKKGSSAISLSTSTSSKDSKRCAAAVRAAEGVAKALASDASKPSPQEVRARQQLAAEAAVRDCLRTSAFVWNRYLEATVAVADSVKGMISTRGDRDNDNTMGVYVVVDGYLSTLRTVVQPFIVSKLSCMSDGVAFCAMTRIFECIVSMCSRGATMLSGGLTAIELCGALQWSLRHLGSDFGPPSVSPKQRATVYPGSVVEALSYLQRTAREPAGAWSAAGLTFPSECFVTLLPILQYALVTKSQDIPLREREDAEPGVGAAFMSPIRVSIDVLSRQLLGDDKDGATETRSAYAESFYACLPVPTLITSLLDSVQIMPAQRKAVCMLLNAILQRTAAARSEGGGEAARGETGVAALKSTLRGLYYEEKYVRLMTLTSLRQIASVNGDDDAYWDDDSVNIALFLSKHDEDEDVKELAVSLYDGLDYAVPENYFDLLKQYLGNSSDEIRGSTCKAVAAAMGVEEHYDVLPITVKELIALYRSKMQSPKLMSSVRTRNSVARILRGAAPALCSEQARSVGGSDSFMEVVKFIVNEGLADGSSGVYDEFMKSGAEILACASLQDCEAFLTWYDTSIEGIGAAANAKVLDKVKRGSMPMIGAAATHYPKGDVRVADVVASMIKVLSTPSESVQRTVADTLVKVVASYAMTSDTAMPALFEELLARLTCGEGYGDRRGAAFGIAACCKGCGISALKKFGVMDALKSAVNDKKDVKKREGALLAFECLCDRLGRLFEPYVIQILPSMLTAYGDGSKPVREAAAGCTKVIMKNLSGQGVKLVLPALLNGLDDKAWRTKQGSVQMLGAMAFCAPTQLSSCLPQIVPQLAKVLGDTHPKVQQAARQSLEQVGSVVRNPEVLSLVPSLLAAIADPTEHTESSLDGIMEAVFAHTIDAPSLSLLIPVVSRGLRERSTESKKKAVTIVSNMCSLVDNPKELSPYLEDLMTEMRKVLIDPIPEMRAVAAKATAMLVAGIGLDQFEDLMVWLRSTIKDNENSVERSGAAQGLSEILAVLSPTYVEEILPSIIQGCKSYSIYEREGSILMLAYLPQTLQEGFAKYLSIALPCVLDGLADETDSIREVSLQAGKVFIRQFAMTAQDMLVSAILSGASNSFWRIRYSSVQLLGDLLFLVAGVTGKIQTNADVQDDGDSVSSEANTRAILAKLGTARRDTTLAALYISRCDQNLQVRQSALHIWKSVVASTPRTLLEIIRELVSSIIDGLASHGNEDLIISCGGALRELVRKLGERVLPSIVPLLADTLNEGSTDTRVGVCAGLVQVVKNSTKNQMNTYLPKLMPVLRDALCDCDTTVREAAGSAFGSLLHLVGEGVLSDVVPMLLTKLGNSDEGDESAEYALDGLRQIIRKHPYVLEGILPSLTSEGPLTANKATALGALSQVAPAVISQRLKETLIPLLEAAGGEGNDKDLQSTAQTASCRVVAAVATQNPKMVVDVLDTFLRSDTDMHRCGAARVLCAAMKEGGDGALPTLLSGHVHFLLSACISRFHDPHAPTLQHMWEAAGAIIANIEKDELPSYLQCVQEAISLAIEHYRRRLRDTNALDTAARGASGSLILPALDIPKALQPLLPVYINTLLNGESPEAREEGAEALAVLISHTSETSLKPSVVGMTGPLIRIFGERCPHEVKAAVLSCLKMLVHCAGKAVKPFLPQLQATFLRCISDVSSADVRSRAGMALGMLLSMSTRVDPVVTEIINGIESHQDADVRKSMMTCLRYVLENAGKSVSQPLLLRARPLAADHLLEASRVAPSKLEDDALASSTAAARVIGLCALHTADEAARHEIISDVITAITKKDEAQPEAHRLAMARAAAGIMLFAASIVVRSSDVLQPFMAAIASLLQDATSDMEYNASIRMSGVRCWDSLSRQMLPMQSENGDHVAAGDECAQKAATASKALFTYVRRLLKDENMAVCSLTCTAIIRCGKTMRGLPGSNADTSDFLIDAVPVLTSIVAENKATKAFADGALYWCLRLDQGSETFAQEYAKKTAGATEKKILTTQYITRLAGAGARHEASAAGSSQMDDV